MLATTKSCYAVISPGRTALCGQPRDKLQSFNDFHGLPPFLTNLDVKQCSFPIILIQIKERNAKD